MHIPGTGATWRSGFPSFPRTGFGGGRRLSSPEARPFAFVEKVKGALRLAAVDRQARGLGLSPGLALADARARVPELLAFDRDPHADRQLLERIARRLHALHADGRDRSARRADAGYQRLRAFVRRGEGAGRGCRTALRCDRHDRPDGARQYVGRRPGARSLWGRRMRSGGCPSPRWSWSPKRPKDWSAPGSRRSARWRRGRWRGWQRASAARRSSGCGICWARSSGRSSRSIRPRRSWPSAASPNRSRRPNMR